MDNFQEFCNQRGVPDHMRDAFLAYIRSCFSTSYAIRSGDTLKIMINNMTQERIEDMWVKFLSEVKQILWSE